MDPSGKDSRQDSGSQRLPEKFSAEPEGWRSTPWPGEFDAHEVSTPPLNTDGNDLELVSKQQVEMGGNFQGRIDLKLCSAVTQIAHGAVDERPAALLVDDPGILDDCPARRAPPVQTRIDSNGCGHNSLPYSQGRQA